MTRPNKRKQLCRKIAKEGGRQRKIQKIQKSETMHIQEHGWESSENEEDVTAIGLMQEREDSESDDSENDEVIVSEGEELEQANESAFGWLMASAMEESRCVWLHKCSSSAETNYLQKNNLWK